MNRRVLAALVALAIGGTHVAALAQTSGLRADGPTSSDVRVGEIDSAARMPPASDPVPLERVVIRDHRGDSRDRGDSEQHRRDGDKSVKDKLKQEIKDKAKDKVKQEKQKIKDRVDREKDKIKDKINDVIDDFF